MSKAGMHEALASLIKSSGIGRAQLGKLAEKACDIMGSTVEAGMYPSLAGKVSFGTDYEITGDDSFTVKLDFDPGSLVRPSLNPNNAGVYDIVGLFTQGWQIADNVRAPFRREGGTLKQAKRWFIGSYFLEEAGIAAGAAINGLTGVAWVGDVEFGKGVYRQ